MIEVAGLGRTDRGLVRPRNEDAYLVDVELGLAVVCDGMGGHAGGDVASALAVSTIEHSFRESRDRVVDVDDGPPAAAALASVLSDGFRRACRDIHSRATGDDGLAGMGCAATAVAFRGTSAVMAHVGDTRLYLIRGGRGHQLSTDHTVGAELVRQGRLSAEDLRRHHYRNVLTRALGTQPAVEVETLLFQAMGGDRFILCSDGLGDHLSSADWLADWIGPATLEDIPDLLTGYALEGGGHDNITVAAIDVSTHPTAPMRRSSEVALDVLSASFLFGDLTLAQLNRVIHCCEARTYEAGRVVWEVGDMIDSIVVVVSGKLAVLADGHRVEQRRGAHLGEGEVLRPRPSRARVVAEEPTDVLALPGPALLGLVRSRPWLGVDLLARLVERLSGDLERRGTGRRTARDLL